MSGVLSETTGWSPSKAAQRDALHVDMALAEGGFARVEPLMGGVAWIAPTGGCWVHVANGYADQLARLAIAEKAKTETLKQVAKERARQNRAAQARAAKDAKALKRAETRAKAQRAKVRARKAKARAAAKAEKNAGVHSYRRTPWTAKLRKGPPLAPKDFRQARKLITEVATRHDVTVLAILGEGRTHDLARARHEAMWRIRELRAPDGERLFSLPRIGRLFRRDHATVSNGLRRHAATLAVPKHAAVSTELARQEA